MFKKLSLRWVAVTCLFTLVSSLVLAHGGATGVVKERMDAMSSMSKSMKTLKTMMRGRSDYNADSVSKEAQNIAKQAGDHLTEMFPKGSAGGASEAKQNIWQQWPKFEGYAKELKILSTGLALAANNIDAAATPTGNTESTMEDMGMGADMMGEATAQLATPESLEGMPAISIFRKLNQNCTACHTVFRSEKK